MGIIDKQAINESNKQRIIAHLLNKNDWKEKYNLTQNPNTRQISTAVAVVADRSKMKDIILEGGYSPHTAIKPSQELLTQNYEKMATLVPKDEIGIFSASISHYKTIS